MNKKKCFIGIDHSVNKSAIVILNELGNPVSWSRIEFKPSGKIKISSNEIAQKYLSDLFPQTLKDKSDHLEKAVYVATVFQALLKHITEDFSVNISPDTCTIAIEDYSFFSPGRTHMIAENGGVFKYAFKLPMIPVNIKKVKKSATGFGGADKDAMRLGLIERFGEQFLNNKLQDNDDVIDAFFIADYIRTEGMLC
jgi:Holliday junction resolvasome RuvABC endonuclease subunit